MIDDILSRQRRRQSEGYRLLRELEIYRKLEGLGAATLCGSMRYGLVVRCDIDIEICGLPDVETGFEAIGRIASDSRVSRVLYLNDLAGANGGLGWDVLVQYGAHDWHIEAWVVPPASQRASGLIMPLRRALTRTRRITILSLKEYLISCEIAYRSIDLYRAVIDGQVETADEYLAWVSKNGTFGQIDWLPRGKWK